MREKIILRVRERELLKQRDNERKKRGKEVTEYRKEKCKKRKKKGNIMYRNIKKAGLERERERGREAGN
jgi:hypothetical protein